MEAFVLGFNGLSLRCRGLNKFLIVILKSIHYEAAIDVSPIKINGAVIPFEKGDKVNVVTEKANKVM